MKVVENFILYRIVLRSFCP